MLNVLAGRLGNDVKLDQGKDGAYYTYASIYVWPGKKGVGKEAPDRDSIPVKIYAKGEQATELAKYKKGETMQFVGKVIDMKYKPSGADKEIIVMGYEVKRIDHSKTIISEFNEILSDYVYEKQNRKEKEQDKVIKPMEQQKTNASQIQKKPEPEIALA